MKFEYNDGGRKKAGYKGIAGDCIVRAISIATEIPYQEVYDELFEMGKNWIGRSKSAKKIRKNPSPRNGTSWKLAREYLKNKGWIRVTGNLKLDDEKFKNGTYLCGVRKHLTVVKDGVLLDSWDSQMTSGHFAPKTIKTVFSHYVREGGEKNG